VVTLLREANYAGGGYAYKDLEKVLRRKEAESLGSAPSGQEGGKQKNTRVPSVRGESKKKWERTLW